MKKGKHQPPRTVVTQKRAQAHAPLLSVKQGNEQIGFNLTDAGALFLAQFLAQGGGFGPTADAEQIWLTDGTPARDSPQIPPPVAQWRIAAGKRAQLLERHLGESDPDPQSIALMLGMMSLWLQERVIQEIMSDKPEGEDLVTSREAHAAIAPLLELLSKEDT